MKDSSIKIMAEGAVMLALSAALSLLSFKPMPQGGSVDITMVPILIFATRHGALHGVLVGTLYGFIDALITGGIGYGWQSLILDYFVACGAIGLAGLSTKPLVSASIGAFAKFFVHLISGVVLYAAYMPDEFMGLSMSNVWFYSALYNGSYMLIDYILALVVIFALTKTTTLVSRKNL